MMVAQSDTILSEQQKRDFCAELLQKFGLKIDVDNELLPILYLSYHTAVVNQTNNRLTNEHITHIIQAFETKTHQRLSTLKPTGPVQFKNAKQAFLFSFAALGLPLLIAILLLAAGWGFRLYHEEQNRVSEFLLKNAMMVEQPLNDSTLVQTLRLYPSGSFQQAKAGKHYVYNSTCQCVEVPLYYVKK